jgi:hypothetical protein
MNLLLLLGIYLKNRNLFVYLFILLFNLPLLALHGFSLLLNHLPTLHTRFPVLLNLPIPILTFLNFRHHLPTILAILKRRHYRTNPRILLIIGGWFGIGS